MTPYAVYIFRFLTIIGLCFSVFAASADDRAGADWWSLQPLAGVVPPGGGTAGLGANPIDAFVAAELEARHLKPGSLADPRAQIRRVYFDLTGMPPSVEEVRVFEADPSEAAYGKIVDALLASPQYGERWARHWLDVARFGESDGFERNAPRDNLWPFRDWVIGALNDDLPYDEFVRMQIAGDLISPGIEGKSAVAFLAAGLHNTVVGGSEFMKKTARQDELEEITGAVAQTFLGLTANCARCHDHKYDPISQQEYYQLTSALAGVFHGEQEVQDAAATRKLVELNARRSEIDAEIGEIDKLGRSKVLAARAAQPAELRAGPEAPQPLARWEFDRDLRDSLGGMHGESVGGARVEGGALVLDGAGAFVKTLPLEKDIAEKTLEAWVVLGNLEQRGGAPISLQTSGGQTFDAIVYGERTQHAWMAGSNGFVRSPIHGGQAESEANKVPVHVAIAYQADGTITRYRNGVVYDKAYKTGFAKFAKGGAEILFGLRHGTSAGDNRVLAGRILRAQFYDRALSPDAVAASAGVETNYVPEKELVAALSPQQRDELARLKAESASLLAEAQRYGSVGKRKVYTVAAQGNPGVTHLLNRGHALQPMDPVAPRAPAAVTGPSADFGLAPDAPDAQRRRKLAEWITHPDNPLFTRVIVNRLWHHHFGGGLVKTPNDLGFNGGQPSHPQLLDWLAGELKSNGYHLKPLHRLMVTSHAYRQSSRPHPQGMDIDASNRLLWRKSPTRLDAESLRDAMLNVSGLLNPQAGGPGFRDVAVNYSNGSTYYIPFDKEGDASLNRRTIYRFSPRGQRGTILESFDCPDPSTAAPSRSVTTTPLQALALLNNAFMLRMAEGLAGRAQREAGVGAGKQTARLYELAYGRAPDDEELALGAELAAAHGLAALARVLFNSNEFVVIE
ncbi:MAG: hypothetical protein ACI9NC_004405 [Verrucomicrobiales bacterium]